MTSRSLLTRNARSGFFGPRFVAAALVGITVPVAGFGAEAPRFPSVLLITVDTLRQDRLSAYGYERATSPAIDALLAGGARFLDARTPEPLTNPAMASLFTSIPPHEHGATRNGIPLRPGLSSLPKILGRRGFRTAAFAGNWTLRDKQSGLDEHFQFYETILNRKRWFGLWFGEATAEDLSEAALAWLDDDPLASTPRPFLLWVHYVEPHAPYRLQSDFVERLGYADPAHLGRSERYDTEIAFVDRAVGGLLAGINERLPAEHLVIVFAADHGESLGEHDEWGHGRTVHDVVLRIPQGITWKGKIPAGQVVEEPASLLDLAPTILGLLGLPDHPGWRGANWSSHLLDPVRPAPTRPNEDAFCFQAHKGAVQSIQVTARARREGLLEVAQIAQSASGARHKEILRFRGDDERALFDLDADPGETRSLVAEGSLPSTKLAACADSVRRGLVAADSAAATPFDPETLEKLRALGYVD